MQLINKNNIEAFLKNAELPEPEPESPPAHNTEIYFKVLKSNHKKFNGLIFKIISVSFNFFDIGPRVQVTACRATAQLDSSLAELYYFDEDTEIELVAKPKIEAAPKFKVGDICYLSEDAFLGTAIIKCEVLGLLRGDTQINNYRLSPVKAPDYTFTSSENKMFNTADEAFNEINK